MEDDALDDDFAMPIACYDDYDWEDNDTSYNIGNLFGTNWETMMIAIVILLVPFILLMMRMIMLMICQATILGMLCLTSMKCLRIYLLQLMFVPSLGRLCLMKMIFLAPYFE